MQKKEYSKSDIQELSWNEAIRKRPRMYIGDINDKGFVELIKGIFSNIISHTKSNFSSIILYSENKVELKFSGLQNPIVDNCSTLSTYTVNHPVLEMGVLNALCSNFEIHFLENSETEICYQVFNKGKLQKGKIEHKEIECNSIVIKFELDKEIWNKDFEYNENYISHEIRNFAYLHKNVKFELVYGKEKCKVLYHFKNGLGDKIEIEKINGLGRSYFDTIIDEQIENFRLEVAFAFREYSVDQPYLESYVNDSRTVEDGSHVEGLLKGLTYGVMKYFQKNKLTGEYKISEKGMKESLVAAIHLKMETPLFSGCVKNKLANSEIIEPIANRISELLFKKIEEDEESTKKLIRKFEI